MLVKESVRISEYKRSKISKILQHSREVGKNYTIVLLLFNALKLSNYKVIA